MTENKETSASDVSAVPEKQVIRRVIFGLLFLFAAILCSRLFLIDDDSLPGGDSIWKVSFHGSVLFTKAGGEVHISPLQNTAYARVFGQHIYHPGMRQKRAGKGARSGSIILVGHQPGNREFHVTFDVHLAHQAQVQLSKPGREDSRDKWLKLEDGVFVEVTRVVELLSKARLDESGPDERVRFLFDYVSEHVSIIDSGSDDGGVSLELRSGSKLGTSRALVSLLRSSHLPARVVTGIGLLTDSLVGLHYWVEAYYQGQWRAMDVVNGNFGNLSHALIPMTRNSVNIARLNGSEPISITIKKELHPSPDNTLYGDSGNPSQIFNLLRISPDGRVALALLILLPIGVLATEFFRQFIGLRTFGTFTPTLLALAAVYTELKTAFVVFSLVIALGVAGRALLPKIRLTRVPRLSIVFTMVASIMVFAVSGLLYFDPKIDTAVVLLPIVVLTSLVDRFYGVADETGLTSALKRLLWTIVLAAVSMLILLQEFAGYWLLQYPEIHLLTIVLIILFGRYRGRQLADNSGFRWIAEPRSINKKSSDSGEDI